MARAMAFCEIPFGLRYSSSQISLGVICVPSGNIITMHNVMRYISTTFIPMRLLPDRLRNTVAQ